MSLLALARRCIGALLLTGTAAWAAASPQQANVDGITRAMEAVVGVQVTVAEEARSAETLGREREGTGVVIAADGLIVTIGYLILEADTIQVTTHDHRVLPARVVGYDQASGLGLVRASCPCVASPRWRWAPRANWKSTPRCWPPPAARTAAWA